MCMLRLTAETACILQCMLLYLYYINLHSRNKVDASMSYLGTSVIRETNNWEEHHICERQDAWIPKNNFGCKTLHYNVVVNACSEFGYIWHAKIKMETKTKQGSMSNAHTLVGLFFKKKNINYFECKNIILDLFFEN